MYKQIRVETWILTARFCVSLVLFWLYNKNCDRAVKQSIGRGEKKRKTYPSSTRRAESSSQLQHSREQCSLKWFYYICCIFRERVRACVHWRSSRLCGVVDAPKDQRQYNLQVATTPINCTRRRRRRREFTIVVGDIIVRRCIELIKLLRVVVVVVESAALLSYGWHCRVKKKEEEEEEEEEGNEEEEMGGERRAVII